MHEIMYNALLAGVALALAGGPLGCIIVWRKMAYFGDAMAHIALLGVALSLMCNGLPMPLAILAVTLLAALVLHLLGRNRQLHADTILGVLAHGALAVGVLLVAMSSNTQVDMEAYLLGNILALERADAQLIAAGAAALLLLLTFYWRRLVLLVLDADLARLHGINIAQLQALLVLLLAGLVALAIQLVGALLITALLIIPAASARYLARSPTQMAIIASLLGASFVALGLKLAFITNAPPAPAIISTAVLGFAICGIGSRLFAQVK
jgi:zinc transport system permease protein